MDSRELKGLELAARARIEWDGEAWLVPSQSSAGRYRVLLTPGAESCACEDFALRVLPCKHIHAARLVRERDGGTKAPVLDTDTIPKKPAVKRDWASYTAGQYIEAERFKVLLHDLCKGVAEPPHKIGRRPHLAKDALFAMAFKVFSGMSSRRFHCDLQAAHKRGFLTRPFPGLKVNQFFENPAFTPILRELITRSALPLRALESKFAVDSSGFSVSRHVRWTDEKYGVERSGRDWVKVHLIVGTRTNVVAAATILDRDANDCPQFKPLVEAAAKHFVIEEVSGDKAYLSHENLNLVDSLGAVPLIPFKSNSTQGEAGSVWERMYFYFQFNREEFLRKYHLRSNAESTFSAIKAKFGDHVRSRTDTAMANEAYAKVLCFNISRVIASQVELGIEAVFWGESNGPRDILPLAKPS